MKKVNILKRNKTHVVSVGNIKIGGENPVTIQSMTNINGKDTEGLIKQINDLEEAGCEIIRLAIKDIETAKTLEVIKSNTNIPIVADIHFDYRIALASMDYGIDKLRINPGNIGDIDRIKKVVKKAKEKNIPIRIGVNSGSLEKDLVDKYSGVTPNGLVESALRHVRILESLDFFDIVVSLKSSNVTFSLESYKLISEEINYPLHIGITEAGTLYKGSIKSAVGIGSILATGIGNTIRVSLTGDPIEEIKCGKEILRSLGLRAFGIEFISCPTCGRTEIDLIKLANEVEEKCAGINKNIKVAIMGCIVNGPGEAREADIGIAGGKGSGIIIKKGKIIRKVKENELVNALIEEINKF